MKKQRLLAGLLVLILLLAMVFAPGAGLADAGNFSGGSDYGGGGGSSDWGGSSSDWGSSSSDWGSSSSGSDYYYDSDGDGGSFTWGALIFFVIIWIVITMFNKNNKRGKTGSGTSGTASIKPQNLALLKQNDPAFSEDAFKEKLANLYIRMQAAWQNKNWLEMRAHMTDALYNQMNRQLQQLINSNQTNYVKNIMVQRVDIVSFAQDERDDIITARVSTRIIDYTVDDNTGKIVSGSDKTEKFLVYEWTMLRSKGVKTKVQEGDTATVCPTCAAPLNINYSAKCEYCGNVVTASEYDWVLSSIKGISQRTGN